MSEHRGDHLIEIGDPAEDSPFPIPVPAPHVVIEFRDRGLPWMLVLPLLVTAAAVAIVGFKAFDRRVRPVSASAIASNPAPAEAPILVAEAPRPPLRIIPDVVARDPSGMPLPDPSPIALPLDAIPPAVDVQPDPPATPVEAPEPPPPAAEGGPSPFLPEDGLPAVPEAKAEAPPLASAPEFGFDLDALERAEIKPDGVRQAANPPPAVAANQPRTVDPNDLPVDPRQAKMDRYQRFLADRAKLETDRAGFHAELRAILRRFGQEAGPQIEDLCARHGTEPDAIAKAQASRLLRVTAAGANQKVRIDLLRKVGYPEAGILLGDIFDVQGHWENGGRRGGPRSRDDVLYKSALILLAHPPRSAQPNPAAPAGRR